MGLSPNAAKGAGSSNSIQRELRAHRRPRAAFAVASLLLSAEQPCAPRRAFLEHLLSAQLCAECCGGADLTRALPRECWWLLPSFLQRVRAAGSDLSTGRRGLAFVLQTQSRYLKHPDEADVLPLVRQFPSRARTLSKAPLFRAGAQAAGSSLDTFSDAVCVFSWGSTPVWIVISSHRTAQLRCWVSPLSHCPCKQARRKQTPQPASICVTPSDRQGLLLYSAPS